MVEEIMTLSPNVALLIVLGLTVLVITICKKWKSVYATWDNLYNWRKKSEEQEKMIKEANEKVQKHEETIVKLSNIVDKLQQEIELYCKENQEHWEASLKYRNGYDARHSETMQAMERISAALSSVVDRLDTMQQQTDQRFHESEERNNKRIRAELKSDISDIYRRHHATGTITSMALEVLENLIEEYEEAKGDNSFVHSIVQKEMYSWSVVEEY